MLAGFPCKPKEASAIYEEIRSLIEFFAIKVDLFVYPSSHKKTVFDRGHITKVQSTMLIFDDGSDEDDQMPSRSEKMAASYEGSQENGEQSGSVAAGCCAGYLLRLQAGGVGRIHI